MLAYFYLRKSKYFYVFSYGYSFLQVWIAIQFILVDNFSMQIPALLWRGLEIGRHLFNRLGKLSIYLFKNLGCTRLGALSQCYRSEQKQPSSRIQALVCKNDKSRICSSFIGFRFFRQIGTGLNLVWKKMIAFSPAKGDSSKYDFLFHIFSSLKTFSPVPWGII